MYSLTPGWSKQSTRERVAKKSVRARHCLVLKFTSVSNVSFTQLKFPTTIVRLQEF
jgi:hypothetical protein